MVPLDQVAVTPETKLVIPRAADGEPRIVLSLATTSSPRLAPQILASYQCDEGTRRLVGQRTKGTVALSDIPAGDQGKVYLIERQLLSRVKHEPGKVALGQPLPEARRQQQLLITIARQKVLGPLLTSTRGAPIVPDRVRPKAINGPVHATPSARSGSR